MPGPDRALSKKGSIAVGVIVAAVGIAIVAVSVFAGGAGFHAPRWVIACVGGAFVFFGGWTAGIYASGFDPSRPTESLPPAWVQLVVFVPGMLMFALPFHWVAFGPGPRQFSGSLSIPFLTIRRTGGAWSGRALFGLGSVLIDVLIVASAVSLIKRARRSGAGAPAGSTDGVREARPGRS